MSVPRIFYSPSYDVSLWGIERLHPFDSRKSSRAWQRISDALGTLAQDVSARPSGPAEKVILEQVHTKAYLESLRYSRVVAQTMEIALLRLLPGGALDKRILLPMRWATQGSVDAAHAALDVGCAINLAGGYHHAHADHGEGFCAYADIPIAIESLRREGKLADDARVAIIDLDVHRGNGFESIYANDPRVEFFDIYNFQIYPGRQAEQGNRWHFLSGLRAHMSDEGYFNILRRYLPQFLERGPYRMAFYIAGTDVLVGDPLGRFDLSRTAVLERDRYVLQSLDHAGIPWVMVPGGGYTDESHSLLAETVIWSCRGRHGQEPFV